MLVLAELAGFGCLSAAAWLVTPAFGLAAIGLSLIVATNHRSG